MMFFESNSILKKISNGVTIKHFAGNNQEDNRTCVSSNVSERALREIYLRGFEIAVKEGRATGLMTSYNKINGAYLRSEILILTISKV